MIQRYKYPETPHLPWSQAKTKDDIAIPDIRYFKDKHVIVTEKLDGECTTIYRDYVHARSMTRSRRTYRSWIFQLQAKLAQDIPVGWRVCGEYMYAKHSLFYNDLDSFFYMFSIWSETNHCLPWDETQAWAQLLDIPLPRILYSGEWDEKTIRGITIDKDKCEGYVVRTAAGFDYNAFGIHVAKYVRAGHVQTDEHWMHGEIVPNQLRKEKEGSGANSNR